MSAAKSRNPRQNEDCQSRAGSDPLPVRVGKPISYTRQEHAAGKSADEAHQMRANVRVLVASPGVHEQGQTTNDRGDAIRPALLRHEFGAPHESGREAKCREHGGRRTYGSMRGFEQQCIQQIAGGRGPTSSIQSRAGFDDLSGHQ